MNTMNTETAGITQGESSNETKHVRTMDNTRAFREIGLDVRMLGLCPKTHHMPIVMASGHAIIATWAGTKADVSLFKHTSKGLCVKATFAASGKSVTAPISAVQVPPWSTVAEACKWASEHGYLRLRQPPEQSADQSQMELQEQAQRSAVLLPDAA